jgi:hypothetical protein
MAATHKEPERIIIIGAIQCDGRLYRSETAEEVRTKIDEAKRYPFPPGLQIDGQPVTWESYRNTLTALVDYRRVQGTQADGSVRTPMADRPPVLVVAINSGEVCQLDLYMGHDFLCLDRLCGDRQTEYDVPNFADKPTYGLRLLGLGIVAWHMGSFQTNVTDQEAQ